MADGVNLYPGNVGTAFKAATDDLGADGHAGLVKLAVSADGSSARIPGDSTNGLYVQVRTMPAAARTTDAVAVALQSDALMNGFTALTPKFFSETVTAADTDEELVALVSAKKIRVLALAVQCGGTATDVTFESSTTTRKHKVPAGINGGQILPFNPYGWFETASGESLTCTTGAGSSVEISGVYVEV